MNPIAPEIPIALHIMDGRGGRVLMSPAVHIAEDNRNYVIISHAVLI